MASGSPIRIHHPILCHDAVRVSKRLEGSIGALTMLLMTPQQWVEKYFDKGSRPSEVTLRRWLSEGKVPGRKVGGTWYVDEHAWLADGNELVLRVLEDQ
jgi:hypothetical protein